MNLFLLPQNKRLITVNILYYLPDHPSIIQEFMWQTDDIIPELTRVRKYLKHWNDHIEAKVKEVHLSCNFESLPNDIIKVDEIFKI